jgi:hypothetical protein
MAGVALAQDSYTVEGVAAIRDNETAKFSRGSVREFRGKLMFDVVIRYTDPEDIPVQGFASRTVTYSVRCESNELSIAVIDLRDKRGRSMKIITVPPGAEEYFTPDSGSREDDWLYRACG